MHPRCSRRLRIDSDGLTNDGQTSDGLTDARAGNMIFGLQQAASKKTPAEVGKGYGKTETGTLQEAAGKPGGSICAKALPAARKMDAPRRPRIRRRTSPTARQAPIRRSFCLRAATTTGSFCRWWNMRSPTLRKAATANANRAARRSTSGAWRRFPWARHCIGCQEKLERGELEQPAMEN